MNAIKKLAAAATIATTLAFAGGTARADVVDCVPERLGSKWDRFDMRCPGVNRWFIAWRSSFGAEHFREMVALVNAAIVAGKPMKIYYNLDGDGNGIIFQVEIFR
jgi:hypothetical protein